MWEKYPGDLPRLVIPLLNVALIRMCYIKSLTFRVVPFGGLL